MHSPARPQACRLPLFLSRRRLLEVGSASAIGMHLPQLLADEGKQQAAPASGKAKSCILFFMEGGPSHIDLWDMKPDAPDSVRGEFRPIDTALPGFQVCEHLPELAKVAQHLAIVRSVSHAIVDHNAASYYILSGQPPFRDSQLIRGPNPENAPPYGSVLAKLRPTGQPLPDYLHLPKQFFNCGDFIPGVLAGFLGESYDPLIAGDPSESGFKVSGLEERFAPPAIERRRLLQGELDRSIAQLGDHPSLDRMDAFYQRAYSMITSPQTRRAFRMEDESPETRSRYGLPKSVGGYRGGGMPHLGQSFLLARRLVEAGVRLVSVWAGGQAFDGHTNHFPALKNALCPPADQALSALLRDLDERGLLDETLVVALAEFGRTPKIGQVTSTAGAGADGRDHWPNAYTAFFAGAGVKPGTIYGASDRFAAYPAENKVSPEDVAATIYTLMGLDPRTRIYDRFNRPHTLADGHAIAGILR